MANKIVVLASFLCLCSTLLLAADYSVPPTNAPPAPGSSACTFSPFTLAVVVDVNKSTSEITYKWTVLRPFMITQKRASGWVDVTTHDVPETATAKFPLDRVPLYDAKGNKLAVDTFVSRVKNGDVILVCACGRLPDSPYLRVFKDETLILVLGKTDTPPIPADPNPPPATYVPNPH